MLQIVRRRKNLVLLAPSPSRSALRAVAASDRQRRVSGVVQKLHVRQHRAPIAARRGHQQHGGGKLSRDKPSLDRGMILDRNRNALKRRAKRRPWVGRRQGVRDRRVRPVHIRMPTFEKRRIRQPIGNDTGAAEPQDRGRANHRAADPSEAPRVMLHLVGMRFVGTIQCVSHSPTHPPTIRYDVADRKRAGKRAACCRHAACREKRGSIC